MSQCIKKTQTTVNMMVNVSKLTNYVMADVSDVLKLANVELYMMVNISN